MQPRIVLVHGFGGTPSDFDPLTEALKLKWGPDAVSVPDNTRVARSPASLSLADQLVSRVEVCVRAAAAGSRPLVVVGYSTGGCIALEAAGASGVKPDLLVLLAVPRHADAAALARWSTRSAEPSNLSLTATCSLAQLVSRARRNAHNLAGCSVLAIHGDQDDLVPAEHADEWVDAFLPAAKRLIIEDASHEILTSGAAGTIIERVISAIEDVTAERRDGDHVAIERLAEVEPQSVEFLRMSRGSARHLSRCPSARELLGGEVELDCSARLRPVFANIEVTTRCNLACRHCARQWIARPKKDMSTKTFANILDRLPHAYRVTLVGLGEPLLHPQVTDLIRIAARGGRRVGVVTNVMELNETTGRAMLEAGLDSIAFSLDGATPGTLSLVRRGSDLDRIVGNIRIFTALARAGYGDVSLAVFSAVSAATLPELGSLLDLVSTLGVHVVVLTDLNFPQNAAWRLSSIENGVAEETLRSAITGSFARGLPVLTVNAIEQFGLARRYQQYLALAPRQIAVRAQRRRHCDSPWQTISVDVNGRATICDCQPDQFIGDLLRTPFDEIWNSERMTEHRRRMLGQDPPEACMSCPRF